MTVVLAYSPAGAYTGAPTLAQAVGYLRKDLFDRTQNLPLDSQGNQTQQRWADDDLTRALDRALDEYSFVSPLVQAAMTATLPGTRAYGLPAGAWWIEQVEYPTGMWPPQYRPFDEVTTPSLAPVPAGPSAAALTALPVSPVGVLTGTYSWAVSFFKSGGETTVGAQGPSVALVAQQASLSALPLGPPGTVGRNLYRYKSGVLQGRVGQVLDNTTTAFVDNASDAAALAGANPVSVDGTANLVQCVLKLDQYQLPRDTSGTLTLTYGGKHQLSDAGTSVPERHHDIVLLGAAGYAMLAYQAPTNDLFDYQDGEFRDHVDERSVSGAWLGAAKRALAAFKERLEQVNRERIAGAAATSQWGDVGIRWQRT